MNESRPLTDHSGQRVRGYRRSQFTATGVLPESLEIDRARVQGDRFKRSPVAAMLARGIIMTIGSDEAWSKALRRHIAERQLATGLQYETCQRMLPILGPGPAADLEAANATLRQLKAEMAAAPPHDARDAEPE